MAIEKGLLIHWWHYYGKCIYTLVDNSNNKMLYIII